MKEKRRVKAVIYHILVFGIGLIMIYPLIWMVMSSFKPTNTIFQTAGSLIPEHFTLENYVNGWKGFAKVTFATFFKNSLFISIVATIGTVISSAIVAYGFARFNFKGKKLLFSAMLLSMMLPAQVLMIPQYLWYQKLNWVGSYMPLIVPYFFAIQGFFVYLISNFISGIPKDLDEAAKIDGCSYVSIFTRIILPLIKPALVTAGIFSFMWRWDDFLSALLYVNKSAKYPVSLALKLFCDPGSSSDYGAMFAMASLSILPSVLIFIFFQRYLVEGISTSGLKG
ncbi:MAG: carbohydrate ABC transporter permease [Lachnospiraceae bacterium]|jgi:multiple sugar transport system permease protein